MCVLDAADDRQKRAEGKLINPSDMTSKPPFCSAGGWGQRSKSQMGHISVSERLMLFMHLSQSIYPFICLLKRWGLHCHR